MTISLNDYLSASGRYNERVKSSELTDILRTNARNLLERVNGLLAELGIDSVVVSSGFRPQSVNTNVPGAAKKSLHCACQAIDLNDDKAQTLGKTIAAHPNLLRKYELFLENLEHTKNKSSWVHLQHSPNMKDRPSRTFIP